MTAWTQTLGRDNKACAVEKDLRASSEGRRRVDDYPLLNCSSSGVGEWDARGCCRGGGRTVIINSNLSGR